MDPIGEDNVAIESCRTMDEAKMVVYGLELRGVTAQVRGKPQRIVPVRGETPFEVTVRREDADRARAALPYIWSGIRGPGPKTDHLGRCASCGYDMAGLEGKWICPECGTDLRPESERRA